MALLHDDSYPKNINPLTETSFMLKIDKLPLTSYFCQEVNLPGIGITSIDMNTPITPIKIVGVTLNYEDLNVKFLVDEDLSNWKELYTWIISNAKMESPGEMFSNPQTYSQLKHNKSMNISATNAHLMILNSQKAIKERVNFVDLYPSSLGSIHFSTTAGNEPITADATFRYTEFTIDSA